MANRCLNKVMLIGNLTRDPELRYTPNGVAVCSFGLATNRRWTTQDGQTKEEAQFHRIVAWNKLAELCAQLLAKGRRVYVEGRLQYREWTGQDNLKRQTAEVVIEDMIILDSRQTLSEGRVEKEAVPPETLPAEGAEEAAPTEEAIPTGEAIPAEEAASTEVAAEADSQESQATENPAASQTDDQAGQKKADQGKEEEEGKEEEGDKEEGDIPF